MEKHKAKDGKVWKSKKSGKLMSEIIILGKNDSISNYEQAEKPKPEPKEEEVEDGREEEESADRDGGD